MPKPKKNEQKKKFVSRCIPELIGKEGRPPKQAAAICYSYWERRKREGGRADEGFASWCAGDFAIRGDAADLLAEALGTGDDETKLLYRSSDEETRYASHAYDMIKTAYEALGGDSSRAGAIRFINKLMKTSQEAGISRQQAISAINNAMNEIERVHDMFLRPIMKATTGQDMPISK